VNYNPGTYFRVIYDTNFFRDVVWLCDWKLFYLEPQYGVYGRDYYDLFKPGHEDWVEGVGYGAGSAYQLPWTFGNIHVTGSDVGGSIKWQNDGILYSLNLVKARWVYEVEVLDRIFEGLTTRNSVTGQEIPWIALKWSSRAWTYNGQPGQIIRFVIRDDVTWQDGTPVTAADIKWNFDFINHTCPDLGTPMPEFFTLWNFYKGATVVDDYTIDIYVNVTGDWKRLDFAGAALEFPQVIWDTVGGLSANYTDITNFDVWNVAYEDAVGHAPPNGLPGLTCDMGTGPYYINLDLGGWDTTNRIVYMSKYPGYWVRNAPQLTDESGVVIGKYMGTNDPIFSFTNFNPFPVTFTVTWGIAGTGSGTSTITLAAWMSTTVTIPNPVQKVGAYQYYLKVNGIPYMLFYAHDYGLGDLGAGAPVPAFGPPFDGLCNGKDLSLFLQCYKGTAGASKYLGDLGGGTPVPVYYKFDGAVNGKDLSLFLQSYKTGIPGPDP